MNPRPDQTRWRLESAEPPARQQLVPEISALTQGPGARRLGVTKGGYVMPARYALPIQRDGALTGSLFPSPFAGIRS